MPDAGSQKHILSYNAPAPLPAGHSRRAIASLVLSGTAIGVLALAVLNALPRSQFFVGALPWLETLALVLSHLLAITAQWQTGCNRSTGIAALIASTIALTALIILAP
jgi:hypothetical protein